MRERLYKPLPVVAKKPIKSDDESASEQHAPIQRIPQHPSQLTPQIILQLQRTHGNQYVNRLMQQNQQLVQRDIIQRGLGDGVGLGDIGGALVQAYEAYNGDESANTIIKAITDLSGNMADTTGGIGDVGTGATSEGVGAWSRLVGGTTNIVAKGTGLVSSLAEYGMGAFNWMAGAGGGDYMTKMADASGWIGGWAKSASDLVSPYAYYTDLVASGSKAVSGIADGWSSGTLLQELDVLAKSGSTSAVKNAAKLLFDVAWWKRVQGYGQGAVGAIEGGAAVFFGPLSKGITIALTKSYEGGWVSYLMRAIGSSFTSSIFSNAQIEEQQKQDNDNLMNYIPAMVENGKIADLVSICRIAIGLGMPEFAQAVYAQFSKPPSGKAGRYGARKAAFKQQGKDFIGSL